jgi:hypothetical protein
VVDQGVDKGDGIGIFGELSNHLAFRHRCWLAARSSLGFVHKTILARHRTTRLRLKDERNESICSQIGWLWRL